MGDAGKKKFFAAISLDASGEHEQVSYVYNKSTGIEYAGEMPICNPIMAFIMDRVLPGETAELFLVVCKGDCYDVDAAPAEHKRRRQADEIADLIALRSSEIFGDGEEVSGDPIKISSVTKECDLRSVKEAFRAKNGERADFSLRVTFITDDDENGERYGNSSKAYIKLFSNLISLIEDNDTIYIDYTYGFKPLVNVWRNLCAYASRAKKRVEIASFSYGSMHGVGNRVRTIYNHRAMFSMDEIITNASARENASFIVTELLKEMLTDYPEDDETGEGEVYE